MILSAMPKITTKKSKRLGQGHGSGKVKTAGRGTKGQKARGDIPLRFAGSSLQASWLKRLPYLRGKGKNKSYKLQPNIVNVKDLNFLKAKSEVTLKSLKDAGLLLTDAKTVKILGDGDLKISLTVKVPCSKGAIEKIKAAGGNVEQG